MGKKLEDWKVGEVGWHSFHGRCVVKGLFECPIAGWLSPYLTVIREYDGEEKDFYDDNVYQFIPIDEWDASKELKRLAEV